MTLLINDQTLKKPMQILYNMLVIVDQLIFSADFLIIYRTLDHDIHIVLLRSFLDTGRALVDVDYGEVKFFLNYEKVYFNVGKSINQPMDLEVVLVIDVINVEVMNYVDLSLVDDPLVGVMWNYEKDKVKVFDQVVLCFMRLGSYTKNHVIYQRRPSFLSHLKLSLIHCHPTLICVIRVWR